MRLNQVLVSALYSSATLLGHAKANEVEFDEVEGATPASIAETATSSAVEKPTFTVGDSVARAAGRRVFSCALANLTVALQNQSTLF